MSNHHILAALAAERRDSRLDQGQQARLARQVTLSRRHARRAR